MTKTENDNQQQILTKFHVKRLLQSFNDIHERALIALSISLGLAREDAVSIRRVWYDQKAGKITYYENRHDVLRTVRIPSEDVRKILDRHVKTCRDSEWLFPSPKTGKYTDRHITGRQAYDIFNEHLARIGFEHRTFLSIKATTHQLCDAAGWSVSEIAEFTGDSKRSIALHIAQAGNIKKARTKRNEIIL